MRQFRHLERRLRSERPQPRDEFVALLSDRLESRSPRRRARTRFALVGAVTVAFAVALATTGGFAYAASAVKNVAVAAKVVVAAPVSIVKESDSHGAKPEVKPTPSHGGKPDDDQYGHKKHVCHGPGKHQVTIEVDQGAVPAHLAHGDYLGDCRK